MLEKALSGGRRYWVWIFTLLGVIGAGMIAYFFQLKMGLSITGMSRDVSWGFYIAQFTYLVGVAASAVMVVLPYYLHHHEKFKRIILFGEFLAVSAVVMCVLFIFVDLGQPMRVMNVLLHPTPNSVMFWDMVVLMGYLILNLVIGWTTLGAERIGYPTAKWVKPLIYLSIPWAVSIHTVTAFLYAGLPGRHLWLTAIMAARFLASAFAAGPALLILLCLMVHRLTGFDVGKDGIRSLSKVVAYAMIANVFFYLLEVFTAFYSGIPEATEPLKYLFVGLEGHNAIVPYMWTSGILAVISLVLLIVPKWRNNLKILPFALIAVFLSTWIDKGMGLVIGGFVPNPLGHVIEYSPTIPELLITVGVYGIGAFLLTVFYKIIVSVRREVAK